MDLATIVMERILIIAHIAFVNDVFSGTNRERKMDITNDGTEMPIYTYPGSDSSSEPGPSEYDESFNKTEDHKITGAPLQESWIVGIVSSKDQIIESYQLSTKRLTNFSIAAMDTYPRHTILTHGR